MFTFLVSFFMAFLAQKLIYTINIWFNFVFGLFVEQDHLLNLFILGIYAKRLPINVHVFQYKNWCSPKFDWLIFFWLPLSEDLSIGRILSEKKIGVTGLLYDRTEVLYAEFNTKERKQPPVVTLQQATLYSRLFCVCD